MEIWRAVWKASDGREWFPVNRKIYLERRFATLSMKHEAGKYAYWDDKEKVWVSANGRKVFKVQKAVVEEWEDLVA